ncbi:hypothetical protein BJ944DRAFT_263233, partial [Cunninghamella echinulata]
MFPEPLNIIPFPFFEDTIHSQPVISINWNPINDLCIILFQDNSLAMCRSDTTIIWTIDDLASNVTCITWHPDGKKFVVGHEDGTVFKYDALYSTPSSIQCWPLDDIDGQFSSSSSCAISSLKWVDYSLDEPKINIPGFDPNEAFDMEHHLPSLSMEPIKESFYPLPDRTKNVPKKPMNVESN